MENELEEYKYINQQIITHQKLMFQIFVFSIIVSVSLLGYGLQNFFGVQDAKTISEFAPLVFLAPMVIIVSSVFLLSAIREDIFRWGAYIAVFHEGDKRTGYETRLNILRAKIKNPLSESYTPFVVSYSLIAAGCTVLYLWSLLSLDFYTPKMPSDPWWTESLRFGDLSRVDSYGFLLWLRQVAVPWLVAPLVLFIALLIGLWRFCLVPSQRHRDRLIQLWRGVREQEELDQRDPRP